jgi:hypothetical protein
VEHHLKRGQVYAPCGQPEETGRQYCTRWRDDHDEHQDDQTLHQWTDATPQPPAWWLTDQLQTTGYDNER